MEKVNPNKILDWTIGALNCRDLHVEYGPEACNHCPLFSEHTTSRFGALETIVTGHVEPTEDTISCNMFDKVVTPLVRARTPVREKDQMSYDYYKITKTYKYF